MMDHVDAADSVPDPLPSEPPGRFWSRLIIAPANFELGRKLVIAKTRCTWGFEPKKVERSYAVLSLHGLA